MKKLIFLTLSLTKGGAERVICNMCNEYLVEKYDITIISLMAAEPEYALDSRIHFRTVDTAVSQYRQNMALRFIRRRKKLVWLLQEITQEGAPQAVISFLPEPNFLITSLAKRFPFPVIISVRNDPAKEYGSKLRYWMMRALYPNADKYVFQTERAKDYFRFSEHIMANGTVIPNPINREFMGITPSAHRDKEIVTVGRLENQKAPLLLLYAFVKLQKEFPDYVLSFYGEGSLRNELEEEIKRLKLTEHVILKGNVDDVRSAIQDAALFVLPSNYEGMPNALMEAMALGIPCIATDCPCGGPAFLIQPEENGLLVPVGDEAALVQAMRSILSDGEAAARMGRKAQEITEKLNPDKIYGSWEYVLQETERKCAE